MSTTQKENPVVWFNGEYKKYLEVSLPLLSHSLHYGGAVFEGIRAYKTGKGKTALFRAPEHIKRFCDSIKVLGYASEFSDRHFMEASAGCIKKNGLDEAYVRPVAFLDDCVRGLKLPDRPTVQSAILVWKWGKYLGDDGQTKGIRATISSFRRPDISTIFTHAKLSGNYLPSVLARQEATLRGFDEALLLDPEGFVAEGSGENLFIVQGKEIITPPPSYILPGITRSSVIEIAKYLGYSVKEQNITRNQLYFADEAFFTGTAVEVTPIRCVDNHTIGTGTPGPITQKLLTTFFSVVRDEVPEFKKWLLEI